MVSDEDLTLAVHALNKQLILLNEQVRTSNQLRAETLKRLDQVVDAIDDLAPEDDTII